MIARVVRDFLPSGRKSKKTIRNYQISHVRNMEFGDHLASVISDDRETRRIGISDDILMINPKIANVKEVVDGRFWRVKSFNMLDTRSATDFPRQIDVFRNEFDMETFGLFKGIDMTNLLIAGGSVARVIQACRIDNDVDVFVYGLDSTNAEARIGKFFDDLQSKIKEQYYMSILVKTEWTTTITINFKLKIQFIHRLFATKAEILQSFDLPSSAVGYDGKDLFFTRRAFFSFENQVLWFDPSRYSETGDFRLYKYMNMGFSLIIQGDHSKTTDFQFGKLKIGKIIRVDVEKRSTLVDIDMYPKLCTNTSDYIDPEDSQMFEFSQIVRSIIVNRKVRVFAAPTFKELMAGDFTRLAGFVGYGRKYAERSFKSLLKYLAKIFTTGEVIDLVMLQSNGLDNEFCDRIRRRELKIFNASIVGYNPKISWIPVDPSKQLTSSFHPVEMSEKDWMLFH